MTSRFARPDGAAPSATGPREDALSDPGRLEELQATGLLETSSTPTFDGLTALTQRLLDVPVATICLVEAEFQHFVSWSGEGAPGEGRTPIANSFCRFAVGTDAPLTVEDANRSPLLRDSPGVTEDGWRAYASAPLETGRGEVLGTLCVLSPEPRRWTEQEERLLGELASIARAEIEFWLRSRRIARLEALARELHDPTETLGDTVRLLTADVDRAASLPRIGRLAAQATSRYAAVESIERDMQEALMLAARTRPAVRAANLAEAVERAVRLATVTAGAHAIELDLRDDELVVEVDPHELQRALSHLVVSSLHHADASKPVKVSLEISGEEGQLMVHAPGDAMPARVLTSVVSRLGAALRDGGGDSEPGRCSMALRDGMRIARTDGITATTGRGGTHAIVTIRGRPPQ